ncbi:hypothetical protein [Paraflavitalea sp. CAU 1676]|uniref:hypothetical protein n=1 Tax=Paraflavitalea sp. CAU 1676 TaxID=3032598 RepID=UPI0023DBC8ED|nr:hypothetical protein [Paraflavitalea sp. CAU 1676]MDF2190532.1 hypothetical protein [Paraflavitalea sp. CAU 1676]
MKRFKMFLGATLLCVAIAGFSAFKAEKTALDYYYYFVPASGGTAAQCVLVEQETDCGLITTNPICETPNSKRIYQARTSATACNTPLFKATNP